MRSKRLGEIITDISSTADTASLMPQEFERARWITPNPEHAERCDFDTFERR
jgi:hypothetical protein